MEVEQSQQIIQNKEQQNEVKKDKIIIGYEMNAQQNQDQQMYIEKDIKEQILEICLQIFPYPQPYSVQIECMKNIINSLCEKQNLLFQSPTGTGKTLVTICSALAYAEKNPNVQVLVLTRTNEQINGFIKEIRKINKYPKISKYSILAGRNQFCLNLDDFKKDFEKQGIKKSKFNKHLTKECNDRCKRTNCETHKAMQSPDLSLFAQNKYVNINQRVFQDQREQLGCTCCPHFKIYKKILKKKQKENLKMDIHFPFVSQGYNQQYNLPDIEDMKELFEQQELGCPFYFNKLATRSAKLVFSTYNYLIKQNILGNIKDLFEGEVVVIFDEAHNISEQAEQEQSTKMQQKYWDQLDTTLQQVQRVFNKNNYSSQNLNNLYRNVQDIICKDIQEEANYFMSSLQKKIVEGESTDTESDKSDLDSSSQEQNDKDDDDVEKVSPKFKHDVKPFCCLFSDKEITKQFQLLNVVDVKQAENFIDRLTKMFTMLQYLKKVIRVYTEKEKKESKSKSDAQRNIFVAENNQIYEANQDDLNNLKKFGEQLKLKYIQKIWFFFYRLIKLRKMYNYSEDPIYLSNHYISLLRGEYSLVPVLQIGCLSASYLFKKIYKKLKISSLILTSGTLEPFELIQKSLDLEFQTYSSPHIINSQTNLFTQFISHYNDQEISFSMKKLENEDNKNNIFYHSQLAIHFITNKFNEYTNQVKQKGGMVIFFKSYSMLQQYYFLIKNYQSNDFRYFVETRDANEFKEIYSQYKQLIQNNRTNCVFLAVNRGKLSEGIDLKDNLCRVVILFGVPYPCFTDPYVVCKRTHAKLYLKEEQWYKKETVKVVNQSAGRCIRYKDDWGCIFFLDSQYYSESNIYKHISKWILDGQKAKVKQTDEWTQHYSEFLSNKAQEYFQKQNF